MAFETPFCIFNYTFNISQLRYTWHYNNCCSAYTYSSITKQILLNVFLFVQMRLITMLYIERTHAEKGPVREWGKGISWIVKRTQTANQRPRRTDSVSSWALVRRLNLEWEGKTTQQPKGKQYFKYEMIIYWATILLLLLLLLILCHTTHQRLSCWPTTITPPVCARGWVEQRQQQRSDPRVDAH